MSTCLQRAVIVAVPVVLVVQRAVDEKIKVIAVCDALVAARRAVPVRGVAVAVWRRMRRRPRPDARRDSNKASRHECRDTFLTVFTNETIFGRYWARISTLFVE
jgi:hypothetical protein